MCVASLAPMEGDADYEDVRRRPRLPARAGGGVGGRLRGVVTDRFKRGEGVFMGLSELMATSGRN